MKMVEKAMYMKQREIMERMYDKCTGEVTDATIKSLKLLSDELAKVTANNIIYTYCPSDFELMEECACDLCCKACWMKEVEE